MREKYDLNKMLEEIREDEKVATSGKEDLSQDMIRKMMMERLKGGRKNK